jgi:GNAT superfamily N-acetyltransferase
MFSSEISIARMCICRNSLQLLEYSSRANLTSRITENPMIDRYRDSDHETCRLLFENAGAWFDEAGQHRGLAQLDSARALVWRDTDGAVRGFLLWEDDATQAGDCRIIDLLVEESHRRRGIGGQLLVALEKQVGPGALIILETLDSSVDYEPYVATRAFYEAHGYRFRRSYDNPTWGGGNTCAEYGKQL